ncbi:unnamed protein product [Hymenolepis diminuta]|uniref:Uncharacterized protein n=1 Tax=Hymenolepis diminuta TaxID=6216 RepID=A0A564Z8K4_HYMDI|nr:unnamed protein product [Hymenolepis diminuta]
MFERLSADVKVLSAKIGIKMSSDVSNTSKTPVFPNSSKNSTQSPVALSPLGCFLLQLVEAAIDDAKLHPSV